MSDSNMTDEQRAQRDREIEAALNESSTSDSESETPDLSGPKEEVNNKLSKVFIFN